MPISHIGDIQASDSGCPRRRMGRIHAIGRLRRWHAQVADQRIPHFVVCTTGAQLGIWGTISPGREKTNRPDVTLVHCHGPLSLIWTTMAMQWGRCQLILDDSLGRGSTDRCGSINAATVLQHLGWTVEWPDHCSSTAPVHHRVNSVHYLAGAAPIFKIHNYPFGSTINRKLETPRLQHSSGEDPQPIQDQPSRTPLRQQRYAAPIHNVHRSPHNIASQVCTHRDR